MTDSDRGKLPPPCVITLGIVGLVVVFCALSFGLTYQNHYAREAERKASQHDRHAAFEAYRPCRTSPLTQLDYCLVNAKREYELKVNDNHRNYADLVAQQRSALWTAIMGVAALIGMALSALGVWLVYTTFREAKRSADAAFEVVVQGKLQTEANILMNKMQAKMIPSLAWPPDLVPAGLLPNGDAYGELHFTIKNTGPTDSTNTRISGNVQIIDNDEYILTSAISHSANELPPEIEHGGTFTPIFKFPVSNEIAAYVVNALNTLPENERPIICVTIVAEYTTALEEQIVKTTTFQAPVSYFSIIPQDIVRSVDMTVPFLTSQKSRTKKA